MIFVYIAIDYIVQDFYGIYSGITRGSLSNLDWRAVGILVNDLFFSTARIMWLSRYSSIFSTSNWNTWATCCFSSPVSLVPKRWIHSLRTAMLSATSCRPGSVR